MPRKWASVEVSLLQLPLSSLISWADLMQSFTPTFIPKLSLQLLANCGQSVLSLRFTSTVSFTASLFFFLPGPLAAVLLSSTRQVVKHKQTKSQTLTDRHCLILSRWILLWDATLLRIALGEPKIGALLLLGVPTPAQCQWLIECLCAQSIHSIQIGL